MASVQLGTVTTSNPFYVNGRSLVRAGNRYYEFYNNGTDLVFRYSDDNMATWSAETSVATGSNSYKPTAFYDPDNNRLEIFWAGGNSTANALAHRAITSNVTSGTPSMSTAINIDAGGTNLGVVAVSAVYTPTPSNPRYWVVGMKTTASGVWETRAWFCAAGSAADTAGNWSNTNFTNLNGNSGSDTRKGACMAYWSVSGTPALTIMFFQGQGNGIRAVTFNPSTGTPTPGTVRTVNAGFSGPADPLTEGVDMSAAAIADHLLFGCVDIATPATTVYHTADGVTWTALTSGSAIGTIGRHALGVSGTTFYMIHAGTWATVVSTSSALSYRTIVSPYTTLGGATGFSDNNGNNVATPIDIGTSRFTAIYRSSTASPFSLRSDLITLSASAGLKVLSNRLVAQDGSQSSIYWASQQNGRAHIQVTTLPASGERVSIIARASSGVETSYRLDLANVAGTVGLKIVKVVGGVVTTLGTASARTWAVNERIGIIINGTSIKAYYLPAGGSPTADAWVELLAVNDSAITASGRWGLEFVSATAVLEDWTYSTLTGTVVVGRSFRIMYTRKTAVGVTFTIAYNRNLTQVGRTFTVKYNSQGRVSRHLVVTYNIGAPPVELPGQRPIGGRVAEELYASIQPVTYADEGYNWPLWKLCISIGTMMQDIDDLIRDPGWYDLLNLPTTPDEALAYLAQYVGVVLPKDVTPAQARTLIQERSGFRRGSIPALRTAAQLFLVGSKTVNIYERDSSAYHLTVNTFASETPDAELVRAALMSQKAAGLVLNYSTTVGETWLQLRTSKTIWQTVKDDYTNWEEVRTAIP